MNFPTKLARAFVPAAVVLAAPAAAKESPDLPKLKAHIAGVQTMTADFVQTDSRDRRRARCSSSVRARSASSMAAVTS